MIAWINGVMVQGSPEEIDRYRILNTKTATTTEFFKIPKDDVPEHVKQYDKYPHTYISSGGQTHRVWY
jgi:hypothetical protein